MAARMFHLLWLLMLISPAHAQPAQHPSKQIEMDREAAEARKKALEAKAADIDKKMARTKDDLVSVAKDIKKNEAKLLTLEDSMAEKRTEQKEIEARLKKDKHSIGNLVLALERLDRTPPEAVLARPGAPLETAQSAMMLQSILPDIYTRAERLKKDVAKLQDILQSLQKDEAQAREESAALTKRREQVAVLLKEREALYKETQGGIRQEEGALREISTRAQNLRDLVTKLEERRKAQEEEERTRLAAAERAASAVESRNNLETQADIPRPRAAMRPTPIPRAGAAQLPISGHIRVSYKQTDEIGAESQGLTIEGRGGALVVSPMGGVVRYAGTFKNYGRIIIVEHQKDYHSLIAGLARIDTVVGQSVAAGEPVGTLPKSSDDGGNPTLYYELRLHGEPVNPARTFKGL